MVDSVPGTMRGIYRLKDPDVEKIDLWKYEDEYNENVIDSDDVDYENQTLGHMVEVKET